MNQKLRKIDNINDRQYYSNMLQYDHILLECWKNNNRIYFKIECEECKHVFSRRYDTYINNPRCPNCFKQKKDQDMLKRIYDYCLEYDYILLTENYIRNSSKLKFLCPHKHVCYISWQNFRNGRRCKTCYDKFGKYQNKEKFKLKYDDVKSYVESLNYTLVSEYYNNAREKLEFVCSENHTFWMTFDNLKRGHRCPTCSNKNKGNYCRWNYDDVKTITEARGFKLLSDDYKNNSEKLKVVCTNGHEIYMSFNHILSGNGCFECTKYSIQEVEQYLYWFKYKLITKSYKDSRQKLTMECPNGHIIEMSFHDFKNRNMRCKECARGKSQAEFEIQNYIIEIYGDVSFNDWSVISNPLSGRRLELDIWIPELKKGIEYNGDYWHSFESVILRDKIKINECIRNNIDLLIIKESEWNTDKNLVLDKVKRFIEE